jgi:excisionase family DNA binding protein
METGIQYFNSQEAAKILGVNVSTIKRWTDGGKLGCIKSAGGHRKFLMEHLATFLETNKKKTEKVNLFPIETETDLRISNHILKGNFNYLNQLVLNQALSCNIERVQQVLNGLYLGQYHLFQIYDKLVTPVLHKIGQMWFEDKISITEEHISSQLILDAIIRLQGIIRLPRKKVGKALCMNFSSEFHSIALKMVEHILELRGYKVYYSGQNTPLIKLENVFKNFHPDRIYISGTIVNDPEMLQREFDEICRLCSEFEAKVYVGGRAFDTIIIDHPAVARRLMTFEDVNNY